MRNRTITFTILSTCAAMHAQTSQVRAGIQKQFPGWSLVEAGDIKKPLNANTPKTTSPGWVQNSKSSFALLFKETGNLRTFRLIHQYSGSSKWAVIHQEDDQIDTAFCWIEPITGGRIKDAFGKEHLVHPDQSILFSFDRAYEAIFSFDKGRWERIVAYTED